MESLTLDFSEALYQRPDELSFTATVEAVFPAADFAVAKGGSAGGSETDSIARDKAADKVDEVGQKKAATGYWIELSDTAFYPEGGGQPADRGQIGPAKVLDVQRQNGAVFHRCDTKLTVGKTYTCRVDSSRRHSLSQQHTGEHILSGLANRHWGFNNVGFHLNEVHMTLDFDGTIEAAEADFLEYEANWAVWADLPVEVHYYTETEAAHMDYRSKLELTGMIRLIDIPGIDHCACCGTHCHRTGEVGLIKIIGREPWRQGTRLTVVCGDRALADYGSRYREGRLVGALLSAPADGLAVATKKLMADYEAERYRAAGLIRRLNDLRVAALPAEVKRIFLFLPEAEEIELKELAKAAAGKIPGSIFLFAPHPRTEGHLFIFASDKEDVREHVKALRPLLQLKGGGNPAFAQGVTQVDQKQVETVMQEYCQM